MPFSSRQAKLAWVSAFWLALLPAAAAAEEGTVIRDSGGSAIWIFANIAYAGMRAQNSPSSVWRIIVFIFGFPGTLLTFFVVTNGSERAYGIELPKRR